MSNTFTGSLVGLNTASTTFNDSPQTYTASGTYSVNLVVKFNDGSSISNIVEIKDYADSGTWTLVDGKLSAKNSKGESTTSDVVFKDDNHMEVTSKIDQEENADIETKVHTKADVTLIYTRR